VTVPVDYLLARGQQVKVFSVIVHKARELGFVCPDNEGIGTDGKYEGATVLDAQKGAYFDIVCGLDFASLVRSFAFAGRWWCGAGRRGFFLWQQGIVAARSCPSPAAPPRGSSSSWATCCCTTWWCS
jgi:hypothetical protein